MSAMRRLQIALVQRWRDTPAVAALIGNRIYNGLAPAGALYPYVRMGEKTEAPGAETFGRDGFTDTVIADVFTATHLTEDPPVYGDEQALQIVEALSASVKSPLAVEGYGSASLRQEFLTVLVEANEVRHAPVRYRVTLVEE